MASELDGMVLKCEKTGKLFFSHKEAELHGEETGLKDFAQVSLASFSFRSLFPSTKSSYHISLH